VHLLYQYKAVNSIINFLNTLRNILLYLLITYCLVEQRVYQLQVLIVDYVSSRGIPLIPVVYQVVGFGRGDGRH